MNSNHGYKKIIVNKFAPLYILGLYCSHSFSGLSAATLCIHLQFMISEKWNELIVYEKLKRTNSWENIIKIWWRFSCLQFCFSVIQISVWKWEGKKVSVFFVIKAQYGTNGNSIFASFFRKLIWLIYVVLISLFHFFFRKNEIRSMNSSKRNISFDTLAAVGHSDENGVKSTLFSHSHKNAALMCFHWFFALFTLRSVSRPISLPYSVSFILFLPHSLSLSLTLALSLILTLTPPSPIRDLFAIRVPSLLPVPLHHNHKDRQRIVCS